MRYVIETYWGWLAISLLVGNLVGYGLSWRRSSVTTIGSWPFLAAIVFVAGVFAALLHWLPGRAGLYLETLLHLTFWYVIGGILGGWLRSAMSVGETTAAMPAAVVAATPTPTPKVATKIPAASLKAVAAPTKQKAAAVSTEASAHAGAKPAVVKAVANPDDLKRIRGIGNQNEGRLHGLGIWHFSQIAAWSADNVKWVSSYLAFSGRIEREEWVKQARELAAGRETAFSKRVTAGKVATSKDDGSLGQKNVQRVKPAT